MLAQLLKEKCMSLLGIRNLPLAFMECGGLRKGRDVWQGIWRMALLLCMFAVSNDWVMRVEDIGLGFGELRSQGLEYRQFKGLIRDRCVFFIRLVYRPGC